MSLERISGVSDMMQKSVGERTSALEEQAARASEFLARADKQIGGKVSSEELTRVSTGFAEQLQETRNVLQAQMDVVRARAARSSDDFHRVVGKMDAVAMRAEVAPLGELARKLQVDVSRLEGEVASKAAEEDVAAKLDDIFAVQDAHKAEIDTKADAAAAGRATAARGVDGRGAGGAARGDGAPRDLDQLGGGVGGDGGGAGGDQGRDQGRRGHDARQRRRAGADQLAQGGAGRHAQGARDVDPRAEHEKSQALKLQPAPDAAPPDKGAGAPRRGRAARGRGGRATARARRSTQTMSAAGLSASWRRRSDASRSRSTANSRTTPIRATRGRGGGGRGGAGGGAPQMAMTMGALPSGGTAAGARRLRRRSPRPP